MRRADVTLGILAGGRGTRLGGRDKAWLARDGVPQVLRWRRRFEGQVARVLASANNDPSRYAAHGIDTVADAVAGAGPLAGLHVLAGACRTRWLLTVPVDAVDCNDCLLPSLASAAGDRGAWAEDDDGPQPLVALWPTAALAERAAAALARGDHAVHALQGSLRMQPVRLRGVRFGNLNTPSDLALAGVA